MSRGPRGRPGASPRPGRAHGSHGTSRWTLASACLAAAAAACTSPGESPSARESTVAVAYCCGDEVLSPGMDTGARRLVFLPLLTFDDAGGWEGRLARSWAHSDDYREWRYGSVARERLESGEFEAAVEVTGIPSDWLSRFFGTGNVLGYENPSVAERIARAEATADPDERDGLFAEITEAFRADPPGAFLFPRIHFFVARRAIRGLSSPWRADPVFHMEELSMEELSLAEEGSPAN